jgi:hypothetical protein
MKARPPEARPAMWLITMPPRAAGLAEGLHGGRQKACAHAIAPVRCDAAPEIRLGGTDAMRIRSGHAS